ncbi:MAG: hypothetical protein IKL22_05960 [Lachnospiraceae bacterium]|nr:hypothetical protein [Lachnospiraceae bacterium]
MDKKECAKKDMKVLDDFYKEYFSKSRIQQGYWVTTGLFTFFLVFSSWFHYQTFWEEDGKVFIIILVMGMYGTVSYVLAYQHAFDKKGTIVKIAPYLRYLPISVKARKKYQFRKLLKFQWKVYAVAQVGQILFSLLDGQGLNWGNFVYPFLAAFLVPVALSALSIAWSK